MRFEEGSFPLRPPRCGDPGHLPVRARIGYHGGASFFDGVGPEVALSSEPEGRAEADAAVAAAVAIDENSVRPWEPGGIEYVAELTGVIDDAWVESFVLIRSRSARFSRFHLNRGAPA